MKKAKFSFRVAAVLVLVAAHSTYGKVIKVRDRFPTIQQAIDWDSTFTGDTISVWGLATETPPFEFDENIDFHNKDLTIINRSFIPGETPGYDSSWEHVIIDGQWRGHTVVMPSYGNSALRGLTIQGGQAEYGGGVAVVGWANAIGTATIVKNRITGNAAESLAGGGVFFASEDDRFGLVLTDNDISWNWAYEDAHGGGVAVELAVPAPVSICRNHLDSNHTLNGGAALDLSYTSGDQDPNEDSTCLVADNDLFGNVGHVEDAAAVLLHGLWPWPLRRNVIRASSPVGIRVEGQGAMFRIGTVEHPGFNVIMGSDEAELVAHTYGGTCHAVGNYWGTIDTDSLLGRISRPSTILKINPVAASGKWFDVVGEQRCTTGVIVTGDLTVCEGASLVIDSGRTFEFLTDPDHSSAAGDPELCDLIVEGGASLQAQGGSGDSTWRVVFRFEDDFGSDNYWYGIRLLPEAQAALTHCDIRRAYIGIDAQSGAEFDIQNSVIRNHQLCGIALDGALATIVGNSIGGNGVYGICAANLVGGTEIVGNTLWDNPTYGIMCDIYDEDDPATVEANLIDAGGTDSTSMYGIVTRTANANLLVHGNSVAHYRQGGICNYYSAAPLTDNALDSNGVYGINCLSSSPRVRWNTISRHQKGVFVDNMSLPDLGTQTDSGYNSILMSNTRWVESQSIVGNVCAEYNWWGTDEPDQYPRKFVGGVDYDPWLEEPPVDGEGGGQSAGRAEALRPALHACYPNPFHGRAGFGYQLAHPGRARITIYSSDGRLLRTLEDGYRKPGKYRAAWDGRDQTGKPVSAGVYLYRLESPGFSAVRKAVLAR